MIVVYVYDWIFWLLYKTMMLLGSMYIVIDLIYLETFAVNNSWTTFVVFFLWNPHLLESRQWSQNWATNPYRVFTFYMIENNENIVMIAFAWVAWKFFSEKMYSNEWFTWRSNDFNFDGWWSQWSDFFLHTIGNTCYSKIFIWKLFIHSIDNSIYS